MYVLYHTGSILKMIEYVVFEISFRRGLLVDGRGLTVKEVFYYVHHIDFV